MSLGWASAFPSDWEIVPLRYVARMGTGHTPDRNKPEYWQDCDIPWVTTVDVTKRPDSLAPLMDTDQSISNHGLANSAAVLHPADTVMLSRTASVGYSVRIGRPMATTQAFVTWTPGPRLDARYLLLVLRAMEQEWRRLAYGSTHLTIYMPDLESIRIPLPSLEEQRRIADFLDAELSKLDRLTEMRSSQLALVVEREMSEIYSAITGRNRQGPRVNSGVDWLGEIPLGWSVANVSHHFEIMLGKMLNQDRVQGHHLAPYLRNTNVQWDVVNAEDLLYMDFPPHEHTRYRVLAGDLLICEGGEPGRCAIWDGSVPEIYYQKALHRARSYGKSSVRWLYYCLRAATWQNVFAVEGNTTTIAHLTREQLQAHRLPFPEKEVQDAIVSNLDRAAVRRRDVEMAIKGQRRLLAERRRALIMTAVTGQIDVTVARGVDVR